VPAEQVVKEIQHQSPAALGGRKDPNCSGRTARRISPELYRREGIAASIIMAGSRRSSRPASAVNRLLK